MDWSLGALIMVLGVMIGSAYVALLIYPPTLISNFFRNCSWRTKLLTRIGIALGGLGGSIAFVYWGLRLAR